MPTNSTYNFVPAPREHQIFSPDWSAQVSHDIPFEDGESGEIELFITAKTPIFIRNGHIKDQKEEEFSHIEIDGQGKKYFIPASSLKGMFRNVLEIISRSRMKQIDNKRYSFRSLVPNSAYMKAYQSNKVECGWLYADDAGDWLIEDCEKPLHITHQAIDDLLGTRFRSLFLNQNPLKKTAKYKYELAKATGNELSHKFLSQIEEYRELAMPNQDGRDGTIVFTGQSGKRKEEEEKPKSGKMHEFVFMKPQNDLPPIIIPKQQQIDFRFIYLEHEQDNISKDWEYWKEELERRAKVPVFFTRSASDRRAVQHFGLAYMYKLPYTNSIQEVRPYNEYNHKKEDLAELIFGHVNQYISPLKGRIMISHAFSNNAQPDTLVEEILASPKASYLPFYVDQRKKKNEYNSYMQEHSELRGYKRYPIHESPKKGNYTKKQRENLDVFSSFIPLQSGAQFVCKVRFHNLRKAEIGALLSAITFHGHSHQYFHSIGGAKPFGYGKISVEVKQLRFLKNKIEDYLIAFEQIMNEEQEANWFHNEAITELLAMASAPKSEEHLVYPQLEIPNVPRSESNEFKNYKSAQQFLQRYSSLNGPIKIQTLGDRNAFEQDILSGKEKFNKERFDKIKKQLRDAGIIQLSAEIQPLLIEAIKFVYDKNRDSKKKLNKSYEWKNTIRNWLGTKQAEALCLELTGKTIDQL